MWQEGEKVRVTSPISPSRPANRPILSLCKCVYACVCVCVSLSPFLPFSYYPRSMTPRSSFESPSLSMDNKHRGYRCLFNASDSFHLVPEQASINPFPFRLNLFEFLLSSLSLSPRGNKAVLRCRPRFCNVILVVLYRRDVIRRYSSLSSPPPPLVSLFNDGARRGEGRREQRGARNFLRAWARDARLGKQPRESSP